MQNKEARVAALGAVLFALLCGATAAGCGDSAGRSGPGCIAGTQQSCVCPGGLAGVQVCDALGAAFSPCMCGATTGTDATATDTDATGTQTAPPTSGMTTDDGPTCGDGAREPGECNEGSAVYCPEDCPEPTGGAQTGTGTGTGTMACDIFAGTTAAVPSVWQSGATMGFDAGGLLCADLGFDHVCDYVELEAAAVAQELAMLTLGTTMWVHRTTVAMVGEEYSGAELGGRCVDWTYSANEFADGEFLEITAEGPVFNLDADTFYDGLDPSHAAPGLLECGGVTRAIPCCHPSCG